MTSYAMAVVSLSLMTSVSAGDASPSVDRKITFEFKEITANNLYKILGELSGQQFVVAREVGAVKVTLSVRNVPVDVAIETLNRYLNVRVRPFTLSDQNLLGDDSRAITVDAETGEVRANGKSVWVVTSLEANASKPQEIADLERELDGLRRQLAATERRLTAARARAE